MADREFQVHVRITRDAIVRVLAGSPQLAERYVQRGEWEDINWQQRENEGDIEVTGSAVDIEDWRNTQV